MLTPATGIDVVSRRRSLARGSDGLALVGSPAGLRPQTTQERRTIDAALHRAASRTDLLLSKLLVAMAGVAAVVVLIVSPKVGPDLTARQLSLCAVAASYFGLSWYLLSHGYGHVRDRLRYVNATVEPMIVTLAIAIVAATKGGAWAASSPAFSLYALAIAVSVCRMQPALCVYTALVSGASYLVLYHAMISARMAPGAIEALPSLAAWAAWERVFWLLLVASVLAFATFRMRSFALATGTEQWKRQRIETEFGRFVSPDVVHAIMRGEASVGTAERREVTVLFCDLRDFTGLCEKQAPEHVVGLLNTFYEQACKIIRAHGGTVNKFLGDGMLALFGAPDEHPNHAHAAAQAAHEILYAVDQLRERGGVWSTLEIGIGLDSGPVVCGAVGAQSRLEYTAIGSTVNRAARLQGLSRQAHRRIVLSRDCVAKLGPRANVISFGSVKLKGFDDPVTVFAFRHS